MINSILCKRVDGVWCIGVSYSYSYMNDIISDTTKKTIVPGYGDNPAVRQLSSTSKTFISISMFWSKLIWFLENRRRKSFAAPYAYWCITRLWRWRPIQMIICIESSFTLISLIGDYLPIGQPSTYPMILRNHIRLLSELVLRV